MNKRAQKTVFVGMSGGVDSSVAAALLKEQGYAVVGVFIKVWQPDFVACTWKEDRLDAMRVASSLDIPFKTLDLESVYKEDVVDYMMREYTLGRTPNPDVMCNREVKFGAFFRYAQAHGADYIATGHYARIATIATDKHETSALLAGADKDKDQSYFLWTLPKSILPFVLFPIGAYQKSEVRELARERGLVTAGKKDSQGLCFIGKVDFRDFLKHFIPQKEGNVVNTEGEIIGRHEGVCFYTVGQRHGFTTDKRTTSERPYYVLKKDVVNNILVVGHKPELSSGGVRTVVCKEVVWRSDIDINSGVNVLARVRYRQDMFSARVCEGGRVVFSTAQTVDVGQSVVWYNDDVCIGGGVIDCIIEPSPS